jgi:hypothetical protein
MSLHPLLLDPALAHLSLCAYAMPDDLPAPPIDVRPVSFLAVEGATMFDRGADRSGQAGTAGVLVWLDMHNGGPAERFFLTTADADDLFQALTALRDDAPDA